MVAANEQKLFTDKKNSKQINLKTKCQENILSIY